MNSCCINVISRARDSRGYIAYIYDEQTGLGGDVYLLTPRFTCV